MHEANRMKRLPLYLFTIIDDLKAKAAARGVDVIDLGMGNPDLPTPPHIVEALHNAAKKVENQRYSRPKGDVERRFKQAIAKWYHQRFGVELDAEREVLPLIGSKEGIAHLSLAFLNNDDIGLIPSPAYPVHFNGVIMAGGILVSLPLSAEHDYKPVFKPLSKEITRMAKLMLVGYPHNPTTATVDLDFYREWVDWGKSKEIIMASDLAYSDIVFDGYTAPSLLQVPGAKELPCIEFHTCSKSYNMAGWRVGWVAGNAEILASLEKTKSYIDFGIFRAVQEAAIAALTGPQSCVKEGVEIYRKRRDLFVEGLKKIGWEVAKPKATFYIWAHVPPKFSALSSLEFVQLLVEEAGVVVAPGTGFGEYGEGFVRFALVEPEERLKTALERIGKVLNISG
ncbi:MAG: alanine transaminase [Candidatus Omnitrophica bacterium CG11_big_fil_rev_8_21_14_0_20_64_10]|nr:MAG: alanine transaminase [Candidatus Omnitrophica bacterium CG11_big_fil_rev_8_21_14_0_20_64_10]